MASASDAVKAGDYIVIQRQDYFKLHKVTPNGTVSLGRDVLDIGSVIDKPTWTTYRMEQKKSGKRNYQLKECSAEDLKGNSITQGNESTLPSGTDNRNIVDDGSSQKLSMEEIVSLRDEGLSSKEIVGTLIENSKTFHNKTEYSQQKYLKKKEKKYFEYLTVRKPTLRLIAEILFKLDPGKIMGLRVDTLSQLNTAVNLHPHGKYILYESGCQGLAAAAMLNGLSDEGRLIHVHPGNYPSQHALLSLNLTAEQDNCLISVNIYNLLRKIKVVSVCAAKPGESETQSEEDRSIIAPTDTVEEDATTKKSGTTDTTPIKEEKENNLSPAFSLENVSRLSDSDFQTVSNSDPESTGSGKRKHSASADDDGSAKKKSRWEVNTDRAAGLLCSEKADGLVLVCREHPASILHALLPLVAPSRNFVVYSQYREPLLDLFIDLVKNANVINLRLTDTWLRYHQVESNRTHPLVNMSGSGGYLLTGVVVDTLER